MPSRSSSSKYIPGSPARGRRGRRESIASAEFIAQALKLKEQLKAKKQERKGILNPLESVFLSRWDVITMIAMVYTALVTPFEVAFIPAPKTVWSGWFLINRGVDTVFLVDMCLQFFIAYEHRDAQNSDAGGVFHTTELIWDRWKIRKHYLCGSFPVDLASILPSAFDVLPLVMDDDSENADRVSRVRTLRALRALRLIKLARLLRAQRVIARWATRISIPQQTLTMMACVLAVVLSAHWYACIFALQASIHDSPSDTWLGVYGYCEDPMAPASGANSLVGRSAFEVECPGLGTGEWYAASFAWAIMIITGCGGTDAYPSSNSPYETLIVILLVLTGALLWTQVLATFCDMATNADPAKIEYRLLIDDVNRFSEREKLPQELRRRLRQYFMQRRHVSKARAVANVIYKMSSSLQEEVTMLVHYHWLRHLWFLRGAEPACLVSVALGTEARVFAPSEIPEVEILYIIHKGCVLFGGRVLTSGKMWGEDIILSNPVNYTMMSARCMTYVETFTVSRATLKEIVKRFPLATRAVKRAALKVALKRTMIRIRLEALKLRRERGGDMKIAGLSAEPDFLEHVLSVALDGQASTKGQTVFGSMDASFRSSSGISTALLDNLCSDMGNTKRAVDDLRAEMGTMRSDVSIIKTALTQLLEAKAPGLPRCARLTETAGGTSGSQSRLDSAETKASGPIGAQRPGPGKQT